MRKWAGVTPKDHKYVPWVLIDGEHSPQAEDDLLQAVCQAYEGEKPPPCLQTLNDAIHIQIIR